MFRLRSKIVTAFSLIILSGTVLMVTIINFSTRSGYETFVRQNDLDICLSLREPLSEFYRLKGTWNGVDSLLHVSPQRPGQMRNMMNNNGFEGSRLRNMIPPIILTDIHGEVLVNTAPELTFVKNKMDKAKLGKGVEILVNNRPEGYLFAGSMLQFGLNQSEKKFLNRTTFIIIAVSIFILIVSIIFSYFFSWRITKPVSALTRATRDIEGGDFQKRVPLSGSDELSDLTGSFNRMADSLENSDKWRKQIIADSAHELRTPVSLIQGNLEMILDGVYEADRKHLQNIYDETLVLSRLIKELQLLSSAESGSLVLNREELDLNVLIDNVMNIFRAGEVKDKITLINSIDMVFPPLMGDYQKLKQVFANVLANAFRHTPEGGNIRISGEIHEGSALVIIEDSGPGIDEEDLEKIFERFYRTDSSRNRSHGGSGLGLSISREILKLHGGSIHAESSSGRGASIFISIPLG